MHQAIIRTTVHLGHIKNLDIVLEEWEHSPYTEYTLSIDGITLFLTEEQRQNISLAMECPILHGYTTTHP